MENPQVEHLYQAEKHPFSCELNRRQDLHGSQPLKSRADHQTREPVATARRHCSITQRRLCTLKSALRETCEARVGA